MPLRMLLPAVRVGLAGLLVVSCGASTGWATVNLGARSFTIRTPRLEAVFQDGLIVSVKNLKTAEVHADAKLADVQVPAGMGHLGGDAKALETLHSVWGTAPLKAGRRPERRYRPLHRPGPQSEFRTEIIAGGIRATWTGLTNGEQVFPQETLVIEAWVDTATGQLLFRSIATSTEGGVAGVQIPLANLHADHRLYVPSFGGVVYDRQMEPALITLGGAPFWEAPVIAMEGRQGSLGLWVEDAQFHPHFGFLSYSGRAFSVAIEYLNLMPFEKLKQVQSFTWRLDAFSGGWVDAMTPYRTWYAGQFAPELKSRAETNWADKIRVIIDHSDHSKEAYQEIATAFGPEAVLFHDWNARAPAFDHDLPDWTPRPGYVDRVKTLHEHGFHSMAYVNTYCVNYNSPVYRRDQIETFGLSRKIRSIGRYTAPWETLAATATGQLLYLDPLSPQWRRYHTDMMIRWREETGTDANYEDVGGTAGDFGNGIVEGLFGAQGAVAQFRELLRRNPSVPMASEYGPADIAFAVRWPLRYQQVWGADRTRIWWMQHMRPVSAYLFGPQQRPWIPVIRAESELSRHVVVACSDALGGLGQVAGTLVELRATGGMPYHMRTRAQLFAQRQLEPWFSPCRGKPDLACQYRDAEGHVYQYFAGSTLQQMIGPDGQPLYQRVTGVRELQTPLVLPGWPATAAGQVWGLNPAARYALGPGTHDLTAVQVVDLPENAKIVRYESTPQRTVLVLAPMDEQASRHGKVGLTARRKFAQVLLNDRSVHRPERAPEGRPTVPTLYDVTLPAFFVLFENEPLPGKLGESLGNGQEQGRYVSVMTGLDRGGQYAIPHRGHLAIPGVKNPPEFFFLNGGSECELTIDYVVNVPAKTALEVYVKNAQARYGNGAIARIYLNGRPVHVYDFGPPPTPKRKADVASLSASAWDTDVHLWHIPLGALAGQPLAVTIASDAKNENNADSLWWTRPVLVSDPDQQTKFIRLNDPRGVSETQDRSEATCIRTLPTR